MPVFSEHDLAFWEGNGYVVLHNAVPAQQLDNLVEVIWDFLEMDPDNRDDWYKWEPFLRVDPQSPISDAGMVSLYQHQTLWDNRQYPRVYEAFTEILGTERLWVSLDRANMKPPARPDKPEWGHTGMVHWDVDTSLETIPFGVQGVLYLTDTAENQGGFQCVPGFHNIFDEWVRTQPPDRDVRFPDLEGLEVKSISGKAGDLLIWDQMLPHGNGHNTSDKPRLAQYITMGAAEEDDELRQMRIEAWQQRRPVAKSVSRGIRWPSDPRDREHKTQSQAVLTDLGRKLLGADWWGPSYG